MSDLPPALPATLPVKYAPNFDGLDMISHGFFGRGGGVSQGKYAGLNAGHGSDDNQGHVNENRSRIANAIGTSSEYLLSNHQYHSTEVIIADKPFTGERPKADGMVTNVPNLALSALSADCAPVLFVDPIAKVIGAAHAGWRGAFTGVTDKTIEAMETLGANREHIRAAIGPCIGAKKFEVGPEFIGEFISENLGYAKFFKHGANDRSLFDMKAYLTQKLKRAGVKHVAALPDCTYSQAAEYFSYRHNCHNDISDYGRNISVIMITQ